MQVSYAIENQLVDNLDKQTELEYRKMNFPRKLAIAGVTKCGRCIGGSVIREGLYDRICIMCGHQEEYEEAL
jgi:hypothetical protein